MREILFRGKLIRSEEWVYGGYSIVDDIRFITDDIDDSFMISLDTVSQYTGLDDSNGNRIFEGDIVESTEEKGYGLIQWSSVLAKFEIVFEKYALDFDSAYPEELTVVGNKWDNPELVKCL